MSSGKHVEHVARLVRPYDLLKSARSHLRWTCSKLFEMRESRTYEHFGELQRRVAFTCIGSLLFLLLSTLLARATDWVVV